MLQLALADLAGDLRDTNLVGSAPPAGTQVDTRAWPGAPRAGAAAAGAAGTPSAADATTSRRRPPILSSLLAAVAALIAACGAASAPSQTAPDVLVPPADAHIAATGLLRVAGGTRLNWARLLGVARAPSQRDLAGPVHIAALERLRASLPDNADLARIAACHGRARACGCLRGGHPAAQAAPSAGGPRGWQPDSGSVCPRSRGRRWHVDALAVLRWTRTASTSWRRAAPPRASPAPRSATPRWWRGRRTRCARTRSGGRWWWKRRPRFSVLAP